MRSIQHRIRTGSSDRYVKIPDDAQLDRDIDEWVERLSHIVPETLYYLRDDRSLKSDSLPDDDDERREQAIRRGLPEPQLDPRTLALTTSLERARDWIGRSAIGAANIGGASTNAIYADVARRIATPSLADDPASTSSKDALRERLVALGHRNDGFTELGLLPETPVAQLVDSLESVPTDRMDAMLSVLVPFAAGLEARLNALEDVRRAVAAFLEQANGFLGGDKSVTFSPAQGLQIEAAGDSLDPALLSSGEKHLLLLLTSTLYTREDPALYIIDEPELSLNMKWQRRLVDALAACTRGSGTSFVMASHSFELMAAARERVVELVAE